MRAPGFVEACRAMGARADPRSLQEVAADLERRWSDANRGYHDLEHLDEVLAALDHLGAATPGAVLAAWFHDAVYTGSPGSDEEASARLAVSALSGVGLAAGHRNRVAALVLVTRDHVPPPGDDEAAALCDADLAILAGAPGRYARYLAGVRREYAHLNDAVFAAGRRAVVQHLLDRALDPEHRDGPLFSTQRGRELWTEPAIANLRGELP